MSDIPEKIGKVEGAGKKAWRQARSERVTGRNRPNQQGD